VQKNAVFASDAADLGEARQDGIGAIDSDIARISFTSPTKPAVITGKSSEESGAGGTPDYRYVLMPIRSAG